MSKRSLGIFGGLVLLLAVAIFSATSTARPRADFSFCNSADVESLDPASASDSSAHRVLSGVFEGLCVLHPKTLVPQPGMADNIVRHADGHWDFQSNDGLTWTFHIREEARWSDGSRLTAEDFAYSFRRVLDPLTAAPYPHLLTDYVVNAEKYNRPQMLQPGDAVEVELPFEHNEASESNRRGQMLRGELIDVSEYGVYQIKINDRLRTFSTGDRTDNAEACRQVLLDFGQVGIRAVDPKHLELTLIRANPAFLQVLAHVSLSPVQQKCLESSAGNTWTHPEKIVSNGAYLVAERRLRDRIRLHKNPRYWDSENIKCEIIDAFTVESPSTMLNLFEAGLVDWIPSVPTSLVDDLSQVRADSLRATPAFSTYFYVFNVRKPPFDDVRLRRALCQAVDRQEVINTALRGGQLPASSFVPGGIGNYSSPRLPPEDRPAASEELGRVTAETRAELAAGRFKLLYNTGETHRAIAELIQLQWRDGLGIAVELENREFGAFRSSISSGEFDIARSGWTGDVSDPIAFLHMFASDSPFNDAGWSNEEYDSLLDAAAIEHDPEQRLKLLYEAEAILLEECPVIPLYHRVSTHLVRPTVDGFFANPSDIHPLKWIRNERSR